MNAVTLEAEVLRGVIPELIAEGYDVFVNPGPPIAPAFLGDLRPDVIAIRGDKKLVVEIVMRPGVDKKLERLSTLLKGQPNWELRVVLVSPATAPDMVEVRTPDVIRQRVSEMQELVANRHFGPALLLGWAAFEASARKLSSEEFRRPQTPGRLVSVLAGEGYLTPSEADRLRRLAEKRNAFVHGELEAMIGAEDVQQLIEILETMLLMIEKGPENV
jgi:REase_AHJR-like